MRYCRTSSLTLATLDALLINLGFAVAWWARYELQLGREVAVANYLPWSHYFYIQIALTSILLIVYQLNGLYKQRIHRSWADELSIIVWGTLIGTSIMIVAVFYYRPFGYSRLVFIYAWVLIVALLNLARILGRVLRAYRWRRGIGLRRVVVVGGGNLGRMIVQNIVAQPHLGYKIVGVIDDERSDRLGRFEWLGGTDSIPSVVSKHEVDEVIVALPSASHRKVTQVLLACTQRRVSFSLVPDFYEMSLNQVDIHQLNGIPLIGLRQPSLQGAGRVAKRIIDVLVSGLLLLCFLPLLGAIALAIRLDTAGPVILRQTRTGLGGKSFDFYKFRSMRADAETQLHSLQDRNEADGPIFKIKHDPRITRVGSVLRRLSLDELPQLFNVLRGDMSLIGPRPPLPREVELYEDWHRKRLQVAPGMTGLWQVSGRSDLPFDEMALLDIWYIDNWSLGLDLKIMLQTVPAVLLGNGAY